MDGIYDTEGELSKLMVSLTLILPIYINTSKKKTVLVGLNWYRNAHYMTTNKVKKQYHEIVKYQIGSVKFPNKVRLEYKLYIKRKGTDPHNVRSIVEKFALDGLVECGAITDDSLEYITGIKEQWFYDKTMPRMEITVISDD